MFEQERKYANRPIQKLTEKGEIPEGGAAQGGAASAEEKFANFCSSCHGMGGKGDGPSGQALNPHPRNFTDVAWQEKTTDERIMTVIKNGGASVGLSSAMAPWGGMLSDDEVKGLVQKIRSFKGK